MFDTKVLSSISTVSQPWCSSAPLFDPAAAMPISC